MPTAITDVKSSPKRMLKDMPLGLSPLLVRGLFAAKRLTLLNRKTSVQSADYADNRRFS
jgi:hypothetical protein